MRTIKDPSTFRQNIRLELIKFFKLPEPHRIIEFVSDMERGIYNWTIKESIAHKILKKWSNPYFVQIYIDRLRTIYCNITNNTDISNRVINGQIVPHEFVYMTHQEMMSDKWEGLIKQKITRDAHKYESNISAATDTFTCRKCKMKKCTYYQMQTRAADEPMTTFVTCLMCDNRWKC